MFSIHYKITCYEGENIEEKTEWICLEQSVELPERIVPNTILDKVKGQVKNVKQVSEQVFEVEIGWPEENVGEDLTQFMNLLFGNISLGRGIKVTHVDWHQLGEIFIGPGFGVNRIREKLNIHRRALSCGVLKPLGSSPEELADRAAEMAAGGIDIIKDDHTIAGQNYAPLKERVQAVTNALKNYGSDSKSTAYFPNITASGTRIMHNYELVRSFGVDGVLLLPHLCGYEIMHEIASIDPGLPIIAHPALTGALISDPEHGFTPDFLYGELFRAFGADFIVYPNTGGRFSFSAEECKAINYTARNTDVPFKPAFPMPGGGVKWQNLPGWIELYGTDTVFLMGSSLFSYPDGLKKAVSEVQKILEAHII